MSQHGIPTEVTPAEIARAKTLGASIALCASAAGFEPKQMIDDLKMDKAQWSRWESGQEGVIWPKFVAVMDKCGNDAPLLWMVHARGYDLASMRKRETELERKLRVAEEKIKELERRNEIQIDFVRNLRVAA